MKSSKYLGMAAALLLLLSTGAFAKDKDKTEHNLKLDQAVQVGTAQLGPGNYKVEWQGTGDSVPVTFLKNGKQVLSTTAHVIEKQQIPDTDQVLLTKTSTNQQRLEELDFGHRKEALTFSTGNNGM